MVEKKIESELRPSVKRNVLRVTQDEASRLISKQLEKGNDIEVRDRILKKHQEYGLTKQEVHQYKTSLSHWDKYNIELLNTIFINSSLFEDYLSCVSSIDSISTSSSNAAQIEKKYADWYHKKVGELKFIKERLSLYDLDTESFVKQQGNARTIGNRVFIVHGHDEGAKQSVARFVEHLGLEPIILGEKTGKGRAIIEKLEQEGDADYAIVLLTADDEGKSREDKDELKLRARQNVILELGYFIGILGRGRVCALKSDDIEIPTDYHGVEYILVDSSGGWKLKLANELEAAGLKIDRTNLR